MILAVPVGTDTRELLSDYGRVNMDDISNHATTYTGMQTREAQNSEMLYHFLMNSVTTEFTTKLVLYQEDYMINGAPIGACLFKRSFSSPMWTLWLTENVPKTLSKAPCLVAKRMSLTLHLLLFEQSM